MKEKKFVNKGGITGTGKSLVNTNSEEFKILRKKIEDASESRSQLERIEDYLIGIRLQMERYLSSDFNTENLSAGEFLKECLKALNVKNNFAAYLGFEESNLSAICHGRRKMSPELALKLGQILQIPAKYWLAIQNKEELDSLQDSKQVELNRLTLEGLLKKSA